MSVYWFAVPNAMMVWDAGEEDSFSLNYADNFDFKSFCRDHSNLEFSEFKELVERKLHKEKDFDYFNKYCIQDEFCVVNKENE